MTSNRNRNRNRNRQAVARDETTGGAASAEPDQIEPAGAAADAVEQGPAAPSWSTDAEPDVWSAPEIDPHQESMLFDDIEIPESGEPASPEDAWLQDAAAEHIASPSAESPSDGADMQHDSESGDRWTVVDESADTQDVEEDLPAADEPSVIEHDTDSDPPVRQDDPDLGPSERADAAATGTDDAAPRSAEHEIPHDSGRAFPVPVTMSPKAKKFGWARESLLTEKAAKATDTPPASDRARRADNARPADTVNPGDSVKQSDRPSKPVATEPRADAARGESADGPFQQGLQVLNPYLRIHRAALLTGAIALLLSVWLLIALPFPLKYAVDAAVASTGADVPAITGVTDNPERALTTSVIVLAVFLVLQVIMRFTAVAALGRVGVRIATTLRSRLLAHLHRLAPSTGGSDAPVAPAARSGGQSDEDAVRSLIEDVSALRDLLSHSGPRVAASALTLLSLLVVTLIVEPLAAAVLLVTGALLALTTAFALRRARAAERTALTESRMLADTADELVAATGTIQSYGLEPRSVRGLTEASTRAGRAVTKARRAESLLHVVGQLVAGLGVAGALLLGGSRIAAGSMSPGDLVLVLAYVLITVFVVRDLLQHFGALKAATTAGDRISALLEREAGIAEPQRTQAVDRVRGEIVFSAVNAADGLDHPLFDAVSLVVPSGQHVALLDREGRESAALISYLLRFEQPDTGRVLLDRFDTRAVSLTDLRRQIAVVQREPVLFTDTVRENIRIGRPEATDSEVEDAARHAGVDDVIAQLSGGFDTVLVRRGDVLTDGQRRRIAIARALLRDAPIVVLDAADADLSGTERQPVLQALATLLEGRTAIVRSLDPETVTAMDRVLWLEHGVVREDGTPAVLAAEPGTHLAGWLSTQDENLR